MSRHIVVGVDGSGPAGAALRWAAAECSRSGLDLLIAVAGDAVTESERSLSGARHVNLDILHHCAATARAASAQCTISTLLREQSPADLLVALSENADLLVIGTHGRGRLTGALLGSVTRRVAGHAHCPVAVVPENWRPGHPRPGGYVAVGVPPSRPGYEALQFAFAAAAQRGVALLVVRTHPGFGTLRQVCVREDGDARADCEQRLLTNLVRAVGRRYPGVEVRTEMSGATAAGALLGAAAHAELLVVGRRYCADKRLSRLALVIPALLPCAPCPVIVVGEPVTGRRGDPQSGAANTARPDRCPATDGSCDHAGRASVQTGSSV